VIKYLGRVLPRTGLDPAAAATLLENLADRALRSEFEPVTCLEAPEPAEVPRSALAEGVPYLILDGKVVDTDRCREKTVSRKGKVIDLWYAGKTRDFGGNIQALFYPCGRCQLVWSLAVWGVPGLGRAGAVAAVRPLRAGR
jgi:hypothetical protein